MTLDEIMSDLYLRLHTADEARDLIDGIMWREINAHVAAEREACKQACEELRGTASMFATSKDCRTHNNAITGCVKAISARGEK